MYNPRRMIRFELGSRRADIQGLGDRTAKTAGCDGSLDYIMPSKYLEPKNLVCRYCMTGSIRRCSEGLVTGRSFVLVVATELERGQSQSEG